MAKLRPALRAEGFRTRFKLGNGLHACEIGVLTPFTGGEPKPRSNRDLRQGWRGAPAWPGLEAEPEQLRRDPSPLRNLSIADVVDHYDKIIRGLDRPPIMIGHSFG